MRRLGGVETARPAHFETTFFEFIRKRGVWLILILFAEEFTAQRRCAYYDPASSEAHQGGTGYYVPLLISTEGRSGSQSSTLVIRGMAVGEIKLFGSWRDLLPRDGDDLVLGMGLRAIGFARSAPCSKTST